MAQAAAGAAFHLLRNKNFRHLAGFDQLRQEEHERIFNELLVGALMLIMLVLEAPDLRLADEEQRAYLIDLSKRIPAAHTHSLRDLSIEAGHLRDWEKLIVMRYEAYARNRHCVRAAALCFFNRLRRKPGCDRRHLRRLTAHPHLTIMP